MHRHEVDQGMGAFLVELGRARAAQPADVPGELDHGELHPEADAEEGNAVLARKADRGDLPLDPAIAEAARDEDRIQAAQQRDRKSTRLNSSHVKISYDVFCLKKKKI